VSALVELSASADPVARGRATLGREGNAKYEKGAGDAIAAFLGALNNGL